MNAGTRLSVYLRDKGRCGLCNRKVDTRNFHLAHDRAASLGGGNNMSNLYVACPWCNVTAGTLSKKQATIKIRRLMNGA